MLNGVRCWQGELLPRRSRTWRIRVFPQGSVPRAPFTEFSVGNLDFRSYPSWQAEALPARRALGPLQVTLLRLEWGVSPGTGKTRALPGEKGWSRAVFRLSEHDTHRAMAGQRGDLFRRDGKYSPGE